MDPDDRVVMELQCSKENKKGNFRILTITGLKLQFPKMNSFFIHLCNLFWTVLSSCTKHLGGIIFNKHLVIPGLSIKDI